jgi:hypothetical protein
LAQKDVEWWKDGKVEKWKSGSEMQELSAEVGD